MKRYLLLVLLIGILGSCTAPNSSLHPTASSTTRPPTIAPTKTKIPPTATPSPTPALNADGPWLLFQAANPGGADDCTTVITNLDGGGQHCLPLPTLHNPLEISKTGTHAAVRITDPDLSLSAQVRKTSVYILSLPDGKVIRRIDLIGELAQNWLAENPPTEYQGLASTILRAPYIWSPDGRYLAFSGALDGESSDLYLYDAIEDQVTQLTDGSKQAVVHSWSPDSRWILHEAAMFYRPQDRVIYSTWAASADGQVRRLEYGPFNQHPIIGWFTEDILLTYTQRSAGSSEELRTVDVTTGKTEFIFNQPFLEAAYDPVEGIILLNIQPVDHASASNRPGIFRLNPESGELVILLPGSFHGLSWSTAKDSFAVINKHAQIVFFDHTGEESCSLSIDTDDRLLFSPDKKWIAVSTLEHSSIYTTTCEPRLEIDLPGTLLWLPDSSGFYYFNRTTTETYTVLRYMIDNDWLAEVVREELDISGTPVLITE